MATQVVVFDQLKRTAMALNKKQRYMLAACAVATLVTLLAFVHYIGGREYKPLFTDLEPRDADRLSADLGAKSIQYELSADGKTISVPADKLDAARIEIAAQGMPHSGRLGFELFDKVSWGQTEFDEKVNYQRAMEGELERTIQTLHDVRSVRVHLVLPAESVFISRERPAKASVIVKTQHGELSEGSQMAISRLVAGAVDSLSAENVTVIDADTNMPMDHRKPAHWVSDVEQEKVLLGRVMSTLGPVLGPDKVRATVDVEFDPSTVEENQDSYDPDSAVALSKQTSEEATGSAAMAASQIGGVPGTSSNTPGKQVDAGANPSDSHRSKSDSATFAVNRVSRHTLQPAGRIRRITAAVVVDDIQVPGAAGQPAQRRKWTPEELAKIEQLAQAALGIDTNRGDHLSVQNVGFEQPVVLPPVKATPVQKVRNTLNDWMWVVRYAGVGLLAMLGYFLLLRPVQRELVKAFKNMPLTKEPAQVAAPHSSMAMAGDDQTNGLFNEEAQEIKKQVIERVKKDPNPTARLIQAWINEDVQ